MSATNTEYRQVNTAFCNDLIDALALEAAVHR
jgi:hypothetical protein